MTTDPLTRISTRQTPQSEQADPNQVANSAGGFSFAVTPENRIRRFLINGVDGGTFYISEQKLTAENAAVVLDWARNRTHELVDIVVEISTQGRAPRQNPGLFALAAAAGLGDVEGRRYALDALPRVARTGTTLFTFATYVEQFRGWGPTLRRAVGAWYTGYPTEALVTDVTRTDGGIADQNPLRSVENVAYQAAKYRQRDGWTHRDLLRLSHGSKSTRKPGAKRSSQHANGQTRYLDGDPELSADRRALFDWISGRAVDLSAHPSLRVVMGYEWVQRVETAQDAARLVGEYGLSWEMIPDRFMNEPEVWDALLSRGVPIGALIRQLPRLTKLGLLTPMSGSGWLSRVTARLTDSEVLRKGRIHPLNMLVAQRTYARGQGKGSTWEPVQQVADALDEGFYASFGAVQPTGKRTMISIDTSGSMSWHDFSSGHSALYNRTGLTPRDIAAALSLVTANVEDEYVINGFSHVMQEVPISPRQRLDDVIKIMHRIPAGGTDCSLPMQHALAEGLSVDTFIVYTDDETWYGDMHPHQALEQYRQKTGIPAKLVSVGMTSNGFTIANPNDAGMLDVVGFDTAVPSVISNFARS
jgi:60 kDa SS-A/Ro ribonucleoprotein